MQVGRDENMRDQVGGQRKRVVKKTAEKQGALSGSLKTLALRNDS